MNDGYLYSILYINLFQAANLFKKKNKPKGLPTDAAGLKEIVTFYEKNYKQLTGPQKSSPVKKPQVDEEANFVKSPAAKLTNGTTVEVGKLVTKEKAAEVESPKEEEDEAVVTSKPSNGKPAELESSDEEGDDEEEKTSAANGDVVKPASKTSPLDESDDEEDEGDEEDEDEEEDASAKGFIDDEAEESEEDEDADSDEDEDSEDEEDTKISEKTAPSPVNGVVEDDEEEEDDDERRRVMLETTLPEAAFRNTLTMKLDMARRHEKKKTRKKENTKKEPIRY